MKITTTRKPGGKCAICGEPLVPGTPGANFSSSAYGVNRGHVDCINKFRTEEMRRMKATEAQRDAERARRSAEYGRRYGTR